MKFLSLICFVALLLSCTKKGNEISEDPSFVSNISKDNNYWKIESAKGFYHTNDSMLFIMVFGESNERLTISFKRDDKNMGEQKSYTAEMIESNCEHCASIKNGYRIDNTKNNSLEFLSLTTSSSPHKIGVRFSINMKKDSVYKNNKPLNIVYDGTVVVPVQNEKNSD